MTQADPTKRKVAVVLMNLGGPDRLEAVKPFLFNLFRDPAIIRLPNPIRWFIAKMISSRRAPIAREIYQQMGGGSPIVPLTLEQGVSLEADLASDFEAKCFVAMRYWDPFSDQAVKEVQAWGADEIVLLSLYPQYSTTTTESSLKEWGQAARAAGMDQTPHIVCCYPKEPGFIQGQVNLIKPVLEEGILKAGGLENVRLLLSAHGLPKSVVDDGDPYQNHVRQTCQAIVAGLNMAKLDWLDCYQSRVGPMEWIGPSTEDEIRRAGTDGKAVVIAPIAFVTEHSETLVELDIEYGALAKDVGVSTYLRVGAIGTEPAFIRALGKLVRDALNLDPDLPVAICQGGHECLAHDVVAGKS